MPTIDNITSLLKRYLQNDLQVGELQKVEELFAEYPDLRHVINDLKSPEHLSNILAEYTTFQQTVAESSKAKVLQVISQQINREPTPVKGNIFKKYALRSAVAASLIPLFFLSFWIFRKHFDVNHATDLAIDQAKDIIGGQNSTLLVSEDGRQLVLDQNADGIVIDEVVRYADGSVLLNDKNQNHQLTLVTPKGGQYNIVLADGTKVWLNADTRLKYPLQFVGSIREVELEGEAYFEVKSDPKKPFIVHTAKENVQVLGTRFNVNSYQDENTSKVSLLEGVVKVSFPQNKDVLLSPGHQSVLKNQSVHVEEVNLEEAIAWKNGEFVFNNEGLGTIVKRIARWYAIDIDLDPSLENVTLWGGISRLDNFAKVLELIRMTDDNIKIKIEGRKVKIMR